MAILDSAQETREFEKLLDEGYYAHERSQNNAEDYAKKEDRDTEAVHKFVNSDLFDEICNQL